MVTFWVFLEFKKKIRAVSEALYLSSTEYVNV